VKEEKKIGRMAGGAPPGKGQPEPAMGGAGGNGGETGQQQNNEMQVTQQQGQAMSVVGGDMYSVGFILVLLILGMMKAAANRCTC
jgi:hypothetical protein